MFNKSKIDKVPSNGYKISISMRPFKTASPLEKKKVKLLILLPGFGSERSRLVCERLESAGVWWEEAALCKIVILKQHF